MKSDLYRLSQKYRGAPTKKSAYAKGGSVRRRFADGGMNDGTGGGYYDGVDAGYGGDGSGQDAATGGAGQGAPAAEPVVVAPASAAPVVVAPQAAVVTPPANAAATTGATTTAAPPDRAAELEALLSRYAPPSNQYTQELAESRRRAQTETEAFTNMVQQMSQRGESPTSRAEMYFRLAAAFGSPTKTGRFAENLSLVGKEMSEYAKGRRAEENDMRNLALKAQEIRMTGARQDLTTTQALASQEMGERRGLAREVVKEYLASGRPQSDAGKLAEDAGLRQGTPEHRAFIDRYLASKLESGELYKQAMLGIQEANLQLRQLEAARKAEKDKELTPQEMTMRRDAETTLNATERAQRTIQEALRINDDTFGTSYADAAQYQMLSAAGSDAPKVRNTARIRTLLSEAAIAGLREAFGSQITDSERAALDNLQGALARTPAQRREILERTFEELQRSQARQRRLVQDITSGEYRRQRSAEPAQPAPGGTP
jgi:hypothetical protein